MRVTHNGKMMLILENTVYRRIPLIAEITRRHFFQQKFGARTMAALSLD